MFTQLNKLYDSLQNKLICESFQSQVIKDLVDTEKEIQKDKSINEIIANINWYLADLGTYESRIEFANKLIQDKNIKKLSVKELIDMYAAEINEEPNYTRFSENKLNTIINLTPDINKMNYNMSQLVSDFDFSNISDDDIQVFTKDQFKDFNRKVRGEFRYVIGVDKDGKIIGWASFDENGTIEYVSMFSRFNKSGRGPKFIDLTNISEKLIAVKNTIVNTGYKKHNERRNNYPYNKDLTPDEKNDEELERNKNRYEETLRNRRRTEKIDDMKSHVNEVLAAAAEIGKSVKEKITDLFDADDELSTTFFNLVKLYKQVKSEISVSYLSVYDKDKFDKYIVQLQKYIDKLNSLMTEKEE